MSAFGRSALTQWTNSLQMTNTGAPVDFMWVPKRVIDEASDSILQLTIKQLLLVALCSSIKNNVIIIWKDCLNSPLFSTCLREMKMIVLL